MNKRGAKHIEVILSFIIFIGFCMAVIYYFNPFSIPLEHNTILEKVYKQISENSSVTLEKYSVVVDKKTEHGGGYSSANMVNINLGKQIEPHAVSSVFDSDGNELESDITDFNSGSVIVNFNNPEKDVIFVYIGQELSPNSFPSNKRNPPKPEEERTYIIASLYTMNVLSIKRINALAEEYETSYNSLREYFGIPEGSDFGFSIEGINTERDSSKGIDVFSKKEDVQVIEMNGSISYEELGVKEW